MAYVTLKRIAPHAAGSSRWDYIGPAADRTAVQSSLQPGEVWLQSDTGQEFVWDGTGWTETPESAALAILTDIATP